MKEYGVSRLGILFCLVGPAGVGKSSIGRVLLDRFGPRLKTSVSVTSRPPRQGEIPGESYIFVSRADFERMVDNGDFLEWEETHGNLYGTPKASFERSLEAGDDLLLDIDIRGAKTFRAHFPNQTSVVALLPPTAEALYGRMKGRGGITEEEMEIRVETAKRELDMIFDEIGPGGAVNYVVVNHDFQGSSDLAAAIYLSAASRGENIQQEKFKEYIASLQKDLA